MAGAGGEHGVTQGQMPSLVTVGDGDVNCNSGGTGALGVQADGEVVQQQIGG